MSKFSTFKARRAELLVELFLEDTAPMLLAKAESSRLPFDFMFGLKDARSKIRNFAVEVKQTERPIQQRFHFLASRTQRDYLRKSDIPVVVFAVDTKRNKLYYGLGAKAGTVNQAFKANTYELSVPMREAGDPKVFATDLVAATA